MFTYIFVLYIYRRANGIYIQYFWDTQYKIFVLLRLKIISLQTLVEIIFRHHFFLEFWDRKKYRNNIFVLFRRSDGRSANAGRSYIHIYIFIYIGGLMVNIYIYIYIYNPKSCNLQLIDSLSLFKIDSTGYTNIQSEKFYFTRRSSSMNVLFHH